MGAAKDLVIRAITRQEADAAVKRHHYSGKVVNNSQLHLGVFYKNRLEGAMQFGPSLDKRKLQGLVEGTPWNGFLELNRMAFSDRLPRNSESRALGIALRMLKRHAPHLQWLITFADAAQCGDGTIYRAAGFVLTGIKPNNQVWVLPSQAKVSRVSVTKGQHIVSRSSMTILSSKGAGKQQRLPTATGLLQPTGGASIKSLAAAGARPLPGFQLRYLYFLDPTARQRLTVPILPFSEIERRGAGMHRGKPRAGSSVSGTVATPGDRGRCDSDPGA